MQVEMWDKKVANMGNILKIAGFVIIGLIAIKLLFFALGLLTFGFFVIKLAVIGIIIYLIAKALGVGNKKA
ncbi:MAG: hypothetical protein FD167_383 [bacterium]|nr:MAG: hypothetical protein FD167_383 [bacterium]